MNYQECSLDSNTFYLNIPDSLSSREYRIEFTPDASSFLGQKSGSNRFQFFLNIYSLTFAVFFRNIDFLLRGRIEGVENVSVLIGCDLPKSTNKQFGVDRVPNGI